MDLLQQIINGLTIGSVYALVAIGFSVVYGALGLVNFAHGDILMAGTFVTYGLYSGLHVPIVLAAVAGILAGIVLAGVVEEIAVRPVLKAHLLIPMMTTLGMGLIIRNVVELKYGSGTLPFPSFAGSGFYTVGDLKIAKAAIATLLVAILTLVVFAAFLRYTKAGFAIRVVAQDMTAARLMGVPVNRTIMAVYGAGGALGVIGGLLYANTLEVVYLGMGFPILLKGFAAAIVGGIGNLQGALLGGLILGILEATVGPSAGSYRDAIAFVLLIAILLVRPAGLLGARVQERV
ncbi:MAG: branched-chain amino acid ABC transporter permease [Nocardioidaceae bacterium]|nr:branched-chain amino acid ABC transporter permease [Nocardioidaceae bacterium]